MEVLDLVVKASSTVGTSVVRLVLTAPDPLPAMRPGQFAELRIDDVKDVLLRRPISIHDFCAGDNELSLLVQQVGAGTEWLCTRREGDVVNAVLPLGNGFGLPADGEPCTPLLIGGGVGVAPLLFLGKELRRKGFVPTFLLGARAAKDVLCREQFEEVGDVYVTTEQGDDGVQGFVTHHPVLRDRRYDAFYVCGPKPMMVAVAKVADELGTRCEVSLENRMACGIGACLCCVEDTKEGNVCVCKEGPVFNINRLRWT